jgi:hypothetical protein
LKIITSVTGGGFLSQTVWSHCSRDKVLGIFARVQKAGGGTVGRQTQEIRGDAGKVLFWISVSASGLPVARHCFRLLFTVSEMVCSSSGTDVMIFIKYFR